MRVCVHACVHVCARACVCVYLCVCSYMCMSGGGGFGKRLAVNGGSLYICTFALHLDRIMFYRSRSVILRNMDGNIAVISTCTTIAQC